MYIRDAQIVIEGRQIISVKNKLTIAAIREIFVKINKPKNYLYHILRE